MLHCVFWDPNTPRRQNVVIFHKKKIIQSFKPSEDPYRRKVCLWTKIIDFGPLTVRLQEFAPIAHQKRRSRCPPAAADIPGDGARARNGVRRRHACRASQWRLRCSRAVSANPNVRWKFVRAPRGSSSTPERGPSSQVADAKWQLAVIICLADDTAWVNTLS